MDRESEANHDPSGRRIDIPCTTDRASWRGFNGAAKGIAVVELVFANHIQHRPEIDDLRRLFRTVREIDRVPAYSMVAQLLQPVDVVSLAAAIIQQSGIVFEQTVLDETLYGLGKIVSGDG